MPPSSLFADDFQSILDQARDQGSGTLALTPSPEDWRDQWIYFLNGRPFQQSSTTAEGSLRRSEFCGLSRRTFRGIQAQLPYLKELGVGAICSAR